MKKFLLVAVLFAASLVTVTFVGCSKDKDDDGGGGDACWEISVKVGSASVSYYYWGTESEAEYIRKEVIKDLKDEGYSSVSGSKKRSSIKSEAKCDEANDDW